MGWANEVEVLRDICHAFASGNDEHEASRDAVRWTRRVLEQDDACVRLFLGDRADRLELKAQDGSHSGPPPESALTRRAFESKKAERAGSVTPPEHATAFVPLVSRGEAFGVLEVTAVGAVVDTRWHALEAVASQCAIALRHARQLAAAQRDATISRHAGSLAADLLKSEDPRAAIRSSMEFCFEALDLPAAGWVANGDPTRLKFVGSRGCGSGRRDMIRSTIGTLRREDLRPGQRRSDILQTFAGIVGTESSELVEAGPWVLMVAGTLPSNSRELIKSLLEEAMLHLAVVSLAEKRNSQLELGLAWTAHELRRPLLVSNLLLRAIFEAPEHLLEDRDRLHRAMHELSRYSTMLDGLLRWSSGAPSLSRQPSDLSALVRELVSLVDEDAARVSITAPVTAVAEVDVEQLRLALLNLLDNALKYSTDEVEVIVDRGHDAAIVTVSDRGVGIPHDEREHIFDPFVRSLSGSNGARGNGLGLYIARRIVEAHGGDIWVEARPKGSSFHVRIPAEVSA